MYRKLSLALGGLVGLVVLIVLVDVGLIRLKPEWLRPAKTAEERGAEMTAAQQVARTFTGVWPFIPEWMVAAGNEEPDGGLILCLLRNDLELWHCGDTIRVSRNHRYWQDFKQLIAEGGTFGKHKPVKFILVGLSDSDSEATNPAAYLAPDCDRAKRSLLVQIRGSCSW